MRVSRLSEVGARSCRVHLAQHVRGGPQTAGTQYPKGHAEENVLAQVKGTF